MNELDNLISSLGMKSNEEIYKRIVFFIAPTNDMQEISITNGWGDEFNDIAEKIERELYKEEPKSSNTSNNSNGSIIKKILNKFMLK